MPAQPDPQSGDAATPPANAAGSNTSISTDDAAARRQFLLTVVIDIALPLAVFYGLRAIGVNQWWALILGGIVPIIRLGYGFARTRRLDLTSAFTLSLLVIGTLIGLLTGDPRLLVARESYLTGVAGLWILGTLLAARPFMYTITMPLLPPDTAAAWKRDWSTTPKFRRALRFMTVGWGLAFVIDAAARVVLAYTIPLDLVPMIGIALMVGMLVAVTQGTKAWAKRNIQPSVVVSDENSAP